MNLSDLLRMGEAIVTISEETHCFRTPLIHVGGVCESAMVWEEYGNSLPRRRAELMERSLASCSETGGMGCIHLRGQQNILKRQLIHVGVFDLSLRQLLGASTPRE